MCARLKASVTGQTAFDPKPSASRWYGVSRSAFPVPEYSVRIVTFWPSSRRLAMSPPHESATSSGWGAMKTWVMAGEYSRAPSGLGGDPGAAIAGACPRRASAACQPPSPTRGTNTHGPSERSVHSLPCRSTTSSSCSRRDPTGITSRRSSPSCSRRAIGDLRGGGRDDDPVPRRAAGPPQAPVARADLHAVPVSEGRQALARPPRPGRDRARWSSPCSRARPGPPPGTRSPCRCRGPVAGTHARGAPSCAPRCMAG